jgi:hypothetical protein
VARPLPEATEGVVDTTSRTISHTPVSISEASHSPLRYLRRSIENAIGRKSGHARRRELRSEDTRVFIGGSMRVWQERMHMAAEEGRHRDDSRAD